MLLSQLLEQFDLQTAAPAPDDLAIKAVRPLSEAGPGDLSFLSNPKYRGQLATTKASVVLIKDAVGDCDAVQVLCKEPYVMLAKIMQVMYPEPQRAAEVHPGAVVDPSATLGEGVHIGPFCVVGADAVIGAGSQLLKGVDIAAGCVVGKDCKLFPNVVLYAGSRLGDRVRIHANSVVGSDGFGYAQDHGIHVKVPQIGGVVIEDDVEIGSNTSIDRGALADTVIGAGTKIDNQVQIAHGVKVGKHAVLVSQTGISGSSTIGNHTVLAGKVGVVGHIQIGDQILVMGDSVVTKNLDKPGRYAGNPAEPHMKYQRRLASLRQLPKLRERLKALEAHVKLLENSDKGNTR